MYLGLDIEVYIGGGSRGRWNKTSKISLEIIIDWVGNAKRRLEKTNEESGEEILKAYETGFVDIPISLEIIIDLWEVTWHKNDF